MRALYITRGSTFGVLTAIATVKIDGRRGTFWRCKCKCGNETVKYLGHIRSGLAKSCGCIKGANRTHQMSHSSEYKAWDNARSRCYRHNDKRYPDYGGRGITMCGAWKTSFIAFIKHMGRKPTPLHSLDRIDNNGNYEPGNCRWATRSEQNLNRRPFKMRTIKEWCGKSDDSRVPAHVRLRIFERDGGRCHLSGRKIMPGDKWELEHIKALCNGGSHRESNLAPALVLEHKIKTKNDRREKAKNDRVRKRHLGIRKPSKFACSRDSKWKRKITGEVVLR